MSACLSAFGAKRTIRATLGAMRLLRPTPSFPFGFRGFALAQAARLEYQYAAGVRGVAVMPIRPLLEGEAFGPEDGDQQYNRVFAWGASDAAVL